MIDLEKFISNSNKLYPFFNSIPHNSFIYETPVSTETKKNPECTIKKDKYTINVEAKCPVIPEELEVQDIENKCLAFKTAERLPNFKDDDSKLKEDLESSGQNVEL